MGFKYFTFTVDDNLLNIRPGSPPDFAPSPEASPRACIGCIGVISRFGVLQLGDGSRDGGAVEEMQGENPGGRNGSAGIVNRIAGMKRKVVLKVSMNGHASRFYWFGSHNPHSKALKLAAGFAGVQSVARRGDQDRIEVIGQFDVVKITTLLRKKVGFAEIVSVSEDKKEGDGGDAPGITMDPQPMMWPSYPRREVVYLEDPYPQQPLELELALVGSTKIDDDDLSIRTTLM